MRVRARGRREWWRVVGRIWTFEAAAVFDAAYANAVVVGADGRIVAVGQLEVGPTQDESDGWVHTLEILGSSPAVTVDTNRVLVGATSMDDTDRQQLTFAELGHDGQPLQR